MPDEESSKRLNVVPLDIQTEADKLTEGAEGFLTLYRALVSAGATKEEAREIIGGVVKGTGTEEGGK